MNALKTLLKLLAPKKKQVPTELLGTLGVTLIKHTKLFRVKAEFKGHAAVITDKDPKTLFDVFKHGTLVLKIGSKRRKIKTDSISETLQIDQAGASLLVEYRPNKKKLSTEDFLFLRVLGQGTFGKVVLAKHKKTGRLYACKIIKKTAEKDSIDKMINEKDILQKISSPFLIHLLASFQTAERVYLILPYVEGGELFKHLQDEKAFSEDRARIYIAELLIAVEHLHRNGIIYRDLKPENILLDREGHIVLCDFGMSVQNEVARTYCGTPEYIAPEIIRGDAYTEAVDYYTLGVLLYEMVTGNPPFLTGEGEDRDDLENKILFSEIEYPEGLSSEIKRLISRLVRKSPERRPKAEEIKQEPFFSGLEWDRVERKEYMAELISVEDDKEESNPAEASGESNAVGYKQTIPGFTYCKEEWDG
ncbi:serum/glucocorticoid-regulated kinase 2 [Nematocida homosporus]|uniref:serum/glucocorticoid-regulated kinase 2 n=1 Tax=Nematocida homosporus TaxID=1912981 RepID=UPI0022201809|nr:serum/glucocorticoid-regulated kinase 2 [Nematocida homosporus]KAI5184938.1 serum/glucocorticoid-regulated kinase 2 [Nematocida homosporus]